MSLQPLQPVETQDPTIDIIRRRVTTSFLMWGALIIVSLFLGGGIGLVIAPMAVGWIILQTMITLYHRNQIESFQHYRQVESLMSLHRLIDIRYPLPPLRLWVISPDFAALIAITIRNQQPTTIVELGSGASTVIGGYALEQTSGGHIYSIEHLSKFAESTRQKLQKHGLDERATVIHAPLTPYPISNEETEDEGQRHWYDPHQFGHITDIDLLIVDGPPEDTYTQARYPALRFFYDRLKDGALILVDDMLREEEHTTVNRWIEEFDLEVIEHLPYEKGAVVLKKTSRAPLIDQSEDDLS